MTGPVYDPSTDTWRGIGVAPADRANGEAVVVGGRMVVGGGGSPDAGDLQSLLVYDIERDAWDVVVVGAPVVDISSGSGVVVLGAHDAVTQDASFHVFDPAGGKVVSAPPVPGVERAAATTVVWDGERLVAAVLEGGDVTTVASWRPGENEWDQVAPVPATEFRPRASANRADSDDAVWFGGWVVLVNGALGRQAVVLATGETLRLDVDAAACGVGAAHVSADNVSFRFGGQRCDGARAGAQTDVGQVLTMQTGP